MNDMKIVFMVGNGFDISTLNKFGQGITTRYKDFYNYYCRLNGDNRDNYIIKSMSVARDAGKENWSDLEGYIGKYLKNGNQSEYAVERLKRDLFEVQKSFSSFLNSIVTDEVILSVSGYCYENQVAKYSYENFLADLSNNQYKQCIFPSIVENHDRIKFEVINFNYTSLLDNYLFLDNEQFDPEPYTTSYNNFNLELNPNHYDNVKYEHHDPFVHINYEIHHPHGNQDVPKSLLFGSEINDVNGENIDAHDKRKVFVKSKMARCVEKYSEIFVGAKLFVIYGCSLGESDSWWWKSVLECILKERAEVVIYIYENENDEDVKDRFIKNSYFNANQDENIVSDLKSHIYIVHCDSDINFLQYRE